jgi:hypothetical protein
MLDRDTFKRLDDELITGGRAVGDFLFGRLPAHPGEVLQDATNKVRGKGRATTGANLSNAFSSIVSKAGSAITGVDEKARLGGLFANAGNNVGAKTTFEDSGSPAGQASSSKGKGKDEDDDWSLASKFMDKSFDFEKRGASIRQGIEGGQNSQNFLYSTSRSMMGLG